MIAVAAFDMAMLFVDCCPRLLDNVVMADGIWPKESVR